VFFKGSALLEPVDDVRPERRDDGQNNSLGKQNNVARPHSNYGSYVQYNTINHNALSKDNALFNTRPGCLSALSFSPDRSDCTLRARDEAALRCVSALRTSDRNWAFSNTDFGNPASLTDQP
jgi:hypothetical protein